VKVKLNDSFNFPHPVLTGSTDDYLDELIDLEIEIEEIPASGELIVRHNVEIESSSLRKLIEMGRARCFMSIVCRGTYFNELIGIEVGGGELRIMGGILVGRVQLRAIIATTTDGIYELENINSEYRSQKFELAVGSILGWTEAQFVSVGMEKLAPMESIFRLAKGEEDQTPGSFAVSQDQEYISIVASGDLFPIIHALRESKVGRPIVLNSVYFPALMSVLESFKSDDNNFAEKRWHRVISAKAEFMGLDLSAGVSLDQAQELLKQPAGRLEKFVKEMP
jgi:hypothetical protein